MSRRRQAVHAPPERDQTAARCRALPDRRLKEAARSVPTRSPRIRRNRTGRSRAFAYYTGSNRRACVGCYRRMDKDRRSRLFHHDDEAIGIHAIAYMFPVRGASRAPPIWPHVAPSRGTTLVALGLNVWDLDRPRSSSTVSSSDRECSKAEGRSGPAQFDQLKPAAGAAVTKRWAHLSARLNAIPLSRSPRAFSDWVERQLSSRR
jgi:hypothetical protein